MSAAPEALPNVPTSGARVSLVIPALNEERSLPLVLLPNANSVNEEAVFAD